MPRDQAEVAAMYGQPLDPDQRWIGLLPVFEGDALNDATREREVNSSKTAITDNTVTSLREIVFDSTRAKGSPSHEEQSRKNQHHYSYRKHYFAYWPETRLVGLVLGRPSTRLG